MPGFPFQIIFEDYYLLVINKPAGLIVEQDSRFPSVEQFIISDLKKQHPGKHKPFVGIVHRLDRLVSGVLLVAKTKQALISCNKQFEDRSTEKRYQAIISGSPAADGGTLTHWLYKDVKGKKAIIYDHEAKNTLECSLNYEVVQKSREWSLVNILLNTGRFHQIRAQMAHIGCPVAGDITYGSKYYFGEGRIGLHATSLTITHPKSGERMTFEAPLPDYFSEIILSG